MFFDQYMYSIGLTYGSVSCAVWLAARNYKWRHSICLQNNSISAVRERVISKPDHTTLNQTMNN